MYFTFKHKLTLLLATYFVLFGFVMLIQCLCGALLGSCTLLTSFDQN